MKYMKSKKDIMVVGHFFDVQFGNVKLSCDG